MGRRKQSTTYGHVICLQRLIQLFVERNLCCTSAIYVLLIKEPRLTDRYKQRADINRGKTTSNNAGDKRQPSKELKT